MLINRLFDCDCDQKKNVKLDGVALQALVTFEATMKDLLAQADAARNEMWAVIKRETGTEGVDTDALKIDREYLDQFGLAVLKVPVDAFPHPSEELEQPVNAHAEPDQAAA